MKPLNRRQFLGAAAATGAVALARSPLGAADAPAAPAAPAPRKVRLGLIGCGWYGVVNAKAALRTGGAEIVAICDVDGAVLGSAAAEIAALQGGRPRTYKHHADLVADPDIEAVVIATPPQWHALQFLAALARGLDIYCEKPLAYDVRESRAMAAAAARTDRIVQVGFQRRQDAAFRAVRDLIAAGSLGRVVQVDAQINYAARLASPEPQPPPATLDWDLWCGPAPLLPYSAQIGHRTWRLERTTGHGHLVDWGIHLVDAARFILGEGAPRAVTAAGGIYQFAGRITTPDSLVAHFEFARCPLTWRHRIWGAEEYAPEVNNGLTFLCEEGSVFVTDGKWIVMPKGKAAERQVHEARTDAGTAHMAEFLGAVRARQAASVGVLDAHHSLVAVKLAMIALETGTRVQWDAATEQVGDNPRAAALLRREYRGPWRHPFPAPA